MPRPTEGPRVLIVDDDIVTCELLTEVFEGEGFRPTFAQDPETALNMVHQSPPDVIVSDIRMRARTDGFHLLECVLRDHPSVPLILITAFGSIETAIRAMKDGAFDYVSKPFDLASLVKVVRRAVASRAPERESSPDEEEPQDDYPLIGRSPAMLEVYKMAAKVADADAAVLITGESGTGKELVARAIHREGKRGRHPFIAVNCGALTETLLESELFGHVRGSFTGAVASRQGIFEQAGEGTVFLDEVGEMSPALQVKMLRVLQEREFVPVGGTTVQRVRARVVAASNMDLDFMAESGEFRRDLWYRMNVVNIHLRPLRERPGDVPLLVEHFLRRFTPAGRPVPALADGVRDLLAAYAWPGNVRELENTIERAVTLSRGSTITEDDLPPQLRLPPHEEGRVETARFFEGLPTIGEMERRYVAHVLQLAGGNRTEAAAILGINRRTLSRMAARYKLED